MDTFAMAKKTILLILVITAGSAIDLGEDEDTIEEMKIYETAIEFVDECGSKELSLCIKEKALRYLEFLPNELDFGEGVRIKPNGQFLKKTTLENLPDEPRAREDAIGNIIWHTIADYISSHTIEFKVPTTTIQELKNSLEEGRGKGGGGNKGGGGGGGFRMKGILMLFQLKAAIIGAIALKLIGLVAFKALLVAKIALTLSSIIALKKLLEQKHHTSTYEVVASHPHHDDYGHFDRSFTQEQMAYKGYEGAARSKE